MHPPRSERLHPELPVFSMEQGERRLLYAPGAAFLVDAADEHALRRALGGARDVPAHLADAADALQENARRALERWRALEQSPYAPECLTLYLSNRCNLGCGYCFAASNHVAPKRRLTFAANEPDSPVLREDAITAAARLVAVGCRAKGKPFSLVLHGGGEPTQHFALLQAAVALTRAIAHAHGLAWRSYIATHGAYGEERARWLAEHFDWIGLSCDGPQDVHDRQRPTAGGRGTFEAVLRSARIFRASNARFTVRMTVTPRSLERLAEDVAYICETMRPDEIRIEPVYRGRESASPGTFEAYDAPGFVDHFLRATQIAREFGISADLSGVRPDEIHGPFCNVLRDVLHLTPDGTATGCFLTTDGRSSDGSEFVVGREDGSGGFEVDAKRAMAMRKRALHVPSRCFHCANAHHCARDCPDVCPVSEGGAKGEERSMDGAGGFRCRVQKLLGAHWIAERAIPLSRGS